MSESDLFEIVRKRWCEVLEIPRVAAQDSFFLSGGHSLLAVRVTNALRGDLGVRIPVAELFEADTLQRYVDRVQDLVKAALDGRSR
jgi:acyl carrier protein